jgi:DNA-binding GntR family transcriptional regulator
MLNRHAPTPLYRQLGDRIEHRIETELEPGDRLPSEGDLAREYDVNRLTVRQALAELVRRGLVETAHGRGTFVAEPPMRYEVSAGSDASFTRTREAAGHRVDLRLLRTTLDEDRGVMRQLRTRRPVRRYQLLRLVDGSAWSLTSTWIASTRFKGLDRHWKGETSLFDALEQHYGVRSVRADRSFAAVPADAVDSEHLTVPLGAPVLVVRGLNTATDGAPVAVVEHHFRGDRVQFTVDLT